MVTEMALAIAYPYAGNLSGGGFLVYRMTDGADLLGAVTVVRF